MAKITIEELYRGEKYDIMSAVTAKALQLGIDERTEEGRTWIEMELVRQTVIAIEQMKKNGDCIAEGELGDAVTVSVSARGRLLKEIFPGVDEKYLEQAFKKIEANGCPKGEDLMEWFGKLVVAEILADSLHSAKENKNEND